MQRFLAISGNWLHSLAFALWFGGILAIGGMVAPAAFHTDRQFAGVVVGDSFRMLNTVSFVCAGVMLAATWAEWRVRTDQARRWLFIRAVLTAAALALGLYLGVRLFPTMLHLRALDRKADFDRLHHYYTDITEVQLWLLGAGSLITSYLALPRKVFRASAAAPEEAPVKLKSRTPQRPSTAAPEHPSPEAPQP
jgi:hypothetical protein